MDTVGEDDIAKIRSIIASHPDGIMVESIMEHGYTSGVIHAALLVLQERGEVGGVDPFRYTGPEKKTDAPGARRRVKGRGKQTKGLVLKSGRMDRATPRFKKKRKTGPNKRRTKR